MSSQVKPNGYLGIYTFYAGRKAAPLLFPEKGVELLIPFLLGQIYGIFCPQKLMAKHSQSIDLDVLNRVRGHGRGWVFTPRHFQDLGTRTAIGNALMRHTQAGTIRHLGRGLYDFPRQDPSLGLLPPSTDDIAKALKGRDSPASTFWSSRSKSPGHFRAGSCQSCLPDR